MENLLEFKIVVTLVDNEVQKLYDMGITPNDEDSNEKMVKYCFDASNIKEMRQSYVKYKGEWLDAVIVSYSEEYIMTPPLIIHYDELKKILDEYHNKNTTIK